MRKISKIFIIHYSKLTERKTHLLTEAEKWFKGIPYEFMEIWDQEELTDQDIQKEK